MNIHLGLIALAMGGFGIGTTEFVMMGLLPDIAASLGVSIAEAGHVISAYALGVVVGAPILTSLAGRFKPVYILLGLVALFTLFNGLSAFAYNYPTLMLFRFLAGLPHGAFFGVGAVVAARLALSGKEASAVSVMFAGLTISNVVGVPLATWIGHTWGWRLAFGLVAVLGVMTVLALWRWIPALESRASQGLASELGILKRANLWFVIGITSIGFGGFFAWMSYLVPLFTQYAQFAEGTVPLLMALAGVGMTVGNWAGGKLADRFAPLPAVIGLMVLLALVLSANALLAASQMLLVLLTFVTGATAMALCAPIQLLLISQSQDAEMFGASLGQSSFNIGNALGAFLGGIPLVYGFAYTSPQWVGAGLSVCGAAIGLGLSLRLKAQAAQRVSSHSTGNPSVMPTMDT